MEVKLYINWKKVNKSHIYFIVDIYREFKMQTVLFQQRKQLFATGFKPDIASTISLRWTTSFS